jgi:hypothetical protein
MYLNIKLNKIIFQYSTPTGSEIKNNDVEFCFVQCTLSGLDNFYLMGGSSGIVCVGSIIPL